VPKLAIPPAIALERATAAVKGIAVDLYDEACFAPKEVDLEAPEARADFGVRQARLRTSPRNSSSAAERVMVVPRLASAIARIRTHPRRRGLRASIAAAEFRVMTPRTSASSKARSSSRASSSGAMSSSVRAGIVIGTV
jgi:hypothetical protein